MFVQVRKKICYDTRLNDIMGVLIPWVHPVSDCLEEDPCRVYGNDDHDDPGDLSTYNERFCALLASAAVPNATRFNKLELSSKTMLFVRLLGLK